MVGIIGYGTQIPRNRITVEEIAKIWGADAPAYKKGLNLFEKSVPSPDEDTATLAVNAAFNALARAGINPKEIGAIYVGSESHPYAVKPTGTIVSEAFESRDPVGSSASKSLGLFIKARTTATRWRCPTDSSPGRCNTQSPSPTRSIKPTARDSTSFL